MSESNEQLANCWNLESKMIIKHESFVKSNLSRKAFPKSSKYLSHVCHFRQHDDLGNARDSIRKIHFTIG